MKKILTVSLVAMMAVSTARADIASTAYVQGAVSAEAGLRTEADTAIKNSIGTVAATNMGTKASTVVTAIKEHSDALATMATSETVDGIQSALSTLQNTVTTNEQDIEGKVANKQDKSTAVTHTASTAVGTTGKPVYIASSGAATVVTGIDASLLPAATTSVKGAVIVDGALSSTSTNPVQNKAVNTALATKEAAANKLKTGDEVQITDSNKDVLFPTIGRVNALVEDLNADVTGEISTLTAGIRDLNTNLGNLSSTVSTNEQDIENKVANKQDKSTAVTHTASTAVGTTGKPVYIASSGAATVVTGIDASLLPAATTTAKGAVIVDEALSSTSTNPVQNKAVNTALAGKQATITDLETIRTGAGEGATAVQKSEVETGNANGTISVQGTDVAVKGLGSAAYTASTAYATATQGQNANTAKGVTDAITGATAVELGGTGADGKYVLTMVKNGTALTYKWEAIAR